MLGGFSVEIIARQAAKESQTDASGVLTAGKWICGSVLERFCCRVRTDEAGNDGGREHVETLPREVDRFDRLLTPQLLDLERVAVETANKSKIGVSAAADSRETGVRRLT